MRDKIVFITGAASGIGLDMCNCFGQKGAKIVMTDLDEKKIHSVAARLKYDGLNVSSLCCDVTDEAQLKDAIGYTHRLHGRLDVLINNAGLQYIFPLEESH